MDPQKGITQFIHRSWSGEAGVCSVFSIVQTADGYIWLATTTGTLRFDGLRFTPLEQGPDEPPVIGYGYWLAGGADGSLWIGRTDNLIRVREGHSQVYGAKDGLPGAWVRTVCEGKDGVIWAGTDAGLFKFVGGRWQGIGMESGFPGGAVDGITAGRSGALWVVVNKEGTQATHLLEVLRPGDTRFQPAGDLESGTEKVAESPDTRMWAVQEGRSVRPFIQERTNLHFVHPEIKVGSRDILFDRDGSLWVTTLGDGLRRVRNTSTLGTNDVGQFGDRMDIFTQKDGLSSDVVYCAFEDREGNVWIGTSTGLDCFSESKVTPISVREGLLFDQDLELQSVADGSVWAGESPQGFEKIGSLGEECVKLDWSKVQHNSEGTRNVYCFHKNPAGALVIGTGAGVVQVQQDGSGAATLPGTEELQQVKAITRDPSGALWLCDPSQGFFRYSGNHLEKMLPLQYERDAQGAAACTDAAGRVWLSRFNNIANGSLCCYEKGQFRWYTPQDGLFSGGVRIIMNDARGRLWVAGRGGLSRFSNGRFQTLTRRNGLADDDIFAVLQDNTECFWLAGRAGLFRVSYSDLDRACEDNSSRIVGELFTREDGLRGFIRGSLVDRGGRAGATVDAHGRVWFATSVGVAVMDPGHIPRNRLPPKVHLEQIIAGGKTNTVFDNLELPIGTRNCEFDYVGLSFCSPLKVRYQYRLAGHDDKWTDAGARRQAFFSSLKPGKYSFQVRACNNDGIWNETGDTLEFSIKPSFYETAWFSPLCILSAALALWGLYWLHLARITARMKLQLEGQMEERKRIAQELHDTLLQGFIGIGLKLDAVANELPDSLASLRERLRTILLQSEQYLNEARRSVWKLRAASLEEGDDLSKAVSDSSRRLLEGTGIQLDLSVDGVRRRLAPIVEDNLLRICEEAIINAVKHANPTQVKVSLEFKAKQVRVCIWDDGCGFNPQGIEGPKTGHFGLIGLQERVRSISGSLSVNSQPGKGTEIIVTVQS